MRRGWLRFEMVAAAETAVQARERNDEACDHLQKAVRPGGTHQPEQCTREDSLAAGISS